MQSDMKYLVITAIREYETEVKDILKKCGVATFSFHEVSGYKNNRSNEVTPHWFSDDEHQITQSILFYVFTSQERARCVLKEVELANTTQEFESKIHIVSLGVEQSNF